MNTYPASTAEKIKPEYFFWGAMLLSLSLWWGGGETPLVSDAEAAAVVQSQTANPFASLSLEAKAAVVYDAKTRRILFEKDANAVLPLASVAKVMTAATALSLVPATTLVTIGADAVKREGDSGFFVGEEWALRDLLRFMLLESSNDAAYAVASVVGMIIASTENTVAGRLVFIEAMNARAAALGLSQTHFGDESGLDQDETETGAVSTARETAFFFADALTQFPEVFIATKWEDLALSSTNGVMREARNTNRETGKFPLLLASKTGFTDLAGGNLVVAFDADFGHPFIVVALGSTEQARFSDVEKLIWATFRYLSTI